MPPRRPRRLGYWLLGADGGIFTYGDAKFFGSTGDRRLNSPVVTMATDACRTGGTGWPRATAACSRSATPGSSAVPATEKLNSPVVGMTPTADGGGYWLVAADGGIFTFGNAPFFGSMGDRKLNSPIVGMQATPSGRGYWMVAADGGIFTFGDAAFPGSAADTAVGPPGGRHDRLPTGDGYWITAADGTVVSKGRAYSAAAG